MATSFLERVIGDLDEKRAWRRLMKRVDALPKDYRFAYRKILNYGYKFGFCCVTQSDLLELFEESAASGRPVLDVVGSDVAAFCDELIRASAAETADARMMLNREIAEHFHGKGDGSCRTYLRK